MQEKINSLTEDFIKPFINCQSFSIYWRKFRSISPFLQHNRMKIESLSSLPSFGSISDEGKSLSGSQCSFIPFNLSFIQLCNTLIDIDKGLISIVSIIVVLFN